MAIFGYVFVTLSKKMGARLGDRNFTRALGYAKHPLSVVQFFAVARFRSRTLPHPADNAPAFFLAKSLTERAGDLLAVKDNLGQSISALGGAIAGTKGRTTGKQSF